MIQREQNWKREEPEDVLTRITDPDEIRDWYKDKYTKLLGRFKCNIFDCIVRSAYLTELQYQKNGTSFMSEVLHLICFVRNSMQYLDVSIFCRTKKMDNETRMWGEYSGNHEAINDFCEIVCRQKVDFLDNYSYRVGEENRLSYPHMCGTKIKVIAVVAKQKTSNTGRFYDVNNFYIFDPDCHSGWELKNGIKDTTDWVVALDKAYGVYQKFCNDNKLPCDIPHPVDYMNQQKQAPVEEVEEEPSQTVEEPSIEDDLPF